MRVLIPRPRACESNDHAWKPVFDRALNGSQGRIVAGQRAGDLAIERGHRTLLVRRKGGKVVRIRLRPGWREPWTSPSASGLKAMSSSRQFVGVSLFRRWSDPPALTRLG